MTPATYTDPEHYQTACQLWWSLGTIFACKEDERLRELEKRIEHAENGWEVSCVSCVAVTISIAAGVNSGAALGWTVFILFGAVLGVYVGV